MERLVDDCIIMDYGRILIQQPVKERPGHDTPLYLHVARGYKMPEDKDFYHPSLIRNTLETFSFLPQQEVETRFKAPASALQRFEMRDCKPGRCFYRTDGKILIK